MIKKWLLRWLIKGNYSSYDNPDFELTMFMHQTWFENKLLMKKLLKIHQGNSIELYAGNKKEADIIRDTIKGLESFIELYYNTVEVDRKEKSK